MKIANATDVKNRFGEFMEHARQEPVTVHRTGRPAVVIVSHQEYERLTALEDAFWGMRAAQAEREGFVGTDAAAEFLQSRLREL